MNEDIVTLLVKSVKESKFPECWSVETNEGYFSCYDVKTVEEMSKHQGSWFNLRMKESKNGNRYITGAALSDKLPPSTKPSNGNVSFAGGSSKSSSDIDAAVVLKAVNELVAHGIIKYEDYEKECNVMVARLRSLQTKMKE